MRTVWKVAVALGCLLGYTGALRADGGVFPPTFEAKLKPGDSVKETLTVNLKFPPKGDIVFAFDQTNSVSDEIGTIRDGASLPDF